MDEVLEAPRVGELVVLPGVVDGQQGEVISLQLEELSLFLVSESLFVLKNRRITGRALNLKHDAVKNALKVSFYLNKFGLKGHLDNNCIKTNNI